MTTNFAILDGKFLQRGIDLLDVPPERICNLLYFEMIEGMSEEDKAKLDNELERPRPGEVPEDGIWATDQMSSDFEKALALQERQKPKNPPPTSTLPASDEAVK